MQLKLELDKLADSWQDVLQQAPNEIWEPSISAFQGSKFWKSAEGASVKPIARPATGQMSFWSDLMCPQMESKLE